MRKKQTPMECLRRAYPNVDSEFIESVLAASDGNVTEALETLRENLGDLDDHDRMLIDEEDDPMMVDQGHDHMDVEQEVRFTTMITDNPWTDGLDVLQSKPQPPRLLAARNSEKAESSQLSEVFPRFAKIYEIAFISSNVCGTEGNVP
jgi:hypothetical protein